MNRLFYVLFIVLAASTAISCAHPEDESIKEIFSSPPQVKRKPPASQDKPLLISGRIINASGKGLPHVKIRIILGKEPPPSKGPATPVRRIQYTVSTDSSGEYSVSIKRLGQSHFYMELSPSSPYYPAVGTKEFLFPKEKQFAVPDITYKETTKEVVRAFYMETLKLKESDMWKHEAHLQRVYRKLKLKR